MPIHIHKNEFETLEYLCDDEWEMPAQISSLEAWLKTNSHLAPGEYVADIGYSVRKGAHGGGGVLTIEMMRMLVAIGMEIYFSEYPWSED